MGCSSSDESAPHQPQPKPQPPQKLRYEGPVDGWKCDIKESQLCGPIWPDTDIQYDDIIHLQNMFEGSELPIITAIEVHHDDVYVHGVQTFYQDGKETALHCAPVHDGCRKERFEFEEDEYMVEVGGRFGHWCDNIWLKTSEGRFHEFGGTGGGHVEFSIDDVDKPHILSVGAGVGGHLHHLKVVYVDHEKYETEGEKKKKEKKKDSPKKEKEDSDKESKKSKKSSKKSDSDSSDKSDKKKKKKGSKSSKKSDSD